MPNVAGVHSAGAAALKQHVPIPSEKEVRAIRKAINNTTVDLADVAKPPKQVQDLANRLQKKEGDDYSVSVQTFAINGNRYYALNVDCEGNGYTNIVSPHGYPVTSYSYSESEGPNWAASPEEARREKTLEREATNLLPRASLGTSKLAKMEVQASTLPASMQANWAKGGAGVQDQHFYKMQLGGKTAYAIYTLYKNPTDKLGFVYLFTDKGDVLGSADITKKTTDKLKFGVGVDRPEE